jgi:signal transduction histidine kinase
MDPQSREMAERLRVNSELMRRLIDEVMDLSRIDVGKMSLHRERIDLRELLTTTLARLQPIPAEKGITVRLLLEGCPAFVDADRCRLQQMVSNLLTNAVKFSPVGGTVTVSATERGQRAEVAVADSGAGFGGSGDRAFERFWQGGSSIEGLGLGLAIVHQLAELHGGSVRIASAVDGGGLVAFTLPVAQPAAPSDHVETRPPRQAPRGAEIYHVKAG